MYCGICNALLERNFEASSRYHEAITQLHKLAGQHDSSSFDHMKSLCRSCLEECERSTSEFRQHKTDHQEKTGDK